MDPIFGFAFECSQQQQSHIVLESVPYAQSGAFAVNLWFQVSLHGYRHHAAKFQLSKLGCASSEGMKT